MMTKEEMDQLLGRDASTDPIPDEVMAGADALPGTGAAAPQVDDYLDSGAQAVPDPAQDAAPDDAGLNSYIDDQAAKAPISPDEPTPAPQAPIVAQTQGNEAKLASTKPSWYDDLAPSKITGAEKAIPGILGSFLTAATGPKQDAAKNFFGGVAPTVGALMNAPQENYQNRLKAADTQAGMHAKLTSGRGDSASLDLAERKFQHLLSNEATKAATLKALKDPASLESKELRDAYVTAGIFKPEEAARMSGYQMQASRVGAQQQSGAERQASNQQKHFNMVQDAKGEWHQIERSDKMEDRALDRGEKLEDRALNQDEKDQQAFIPGKVYVGKHAPNIAAVEKARVIDENTGTAMTAADHLIDIWGKMSNRAKLTPGFLEGSLSEDDLALVNEARNWAINLDTAQRNLANMGVPQQFEMEIVKSINPDPSGIRAFLNNGAAWRAQKSVLGALANRKLRAYGYVDEGTPEAAAARPPHPQQSLGGKLKEAGAASKGIVKDAVEAGTQVVSGAVDTAKDVLAPAAKTFQVQVFDPVKKVWGAARDVTDEQYRQAMKSLAAKGLKPDHIRKAQ